MRTKAINSNNCELINNHTQNEHRIRPQYVCSQGDPKLLWQTIVQELDESRGGRSGLSVLTSLLASVDVKIY